MKITKLQTFLANSGLRNYLFIKLHTDKGMTGIGEATLEWQEATVRTLIHEFLEDRYVMGANPFDVEKLVAQMVRDQYQGGSTIMTAISGIEIAMWDIIAKDCGKPLYSILGGRCHERLRAYANGWYGDARTPQDCADRAKGVVQRGYTALKFDPFATAWKELTSAKREHAVEVVEAVRCAVGDQVELMIEGHGRFDVETAVQVAQLLEPYHVAWFEEPVVSDRIDLLAAIKQRVGMRVAAGERLYTLSDFYHLISKRAADVIQPDIAHCGGILMGKKIAAIAAAEDLPVSPHCSVGPVALAAALDFDVSTPSFNIQEDFGEFDVPWRSSLVGGWNPIREGFFHFSEEPGLGLDLNEDEVMAHPYVKNSFPSLGDKRWHEEFTQTGRDAKSDGGGEG